MKNILIIEDEALIRFSYSIILEDEDCDFDLASSGEEGLKKVMDKSYDIILLDFRMPGMNGVETFAELRKINNYAFVYFITGYYDECFNELDKLSYDKSRVDILQKPVDMERLRDIVKKNKST